MRRLLVILTLCLPSFAADIYITQATSGSDTGANCANAHSITWFNSNQSGGNIYHLCGTFTGAAGATILNVSAGSAGNIKTILFESGAVMTAPVWGSGAGAYPSGGAININGSYVTVDGGTNGLITATDSGAAGTTCPDTTTCSYDRTTAGIVVASGLNTVEIKNLSITNIYLCNNAATCNASWFTSDIFVGPSASATNLSIHDNKLDGAGAHVMIEYSGHALTNVNVYNNTIGALHGGYWGVAISSGSAGNTTFGVNVYGNTISGSPDWNGQYAGGNGYHGDGVIVYSTSTAQTFNIYNNTINETGAVTAGIFCTYGSTATGAACNIFNNVLTINNPTCSGVGGGRDIWAHDGAGSQVIVNNTLAGVSSSCFLIEAEGTAPFTRFENNILTQENWGVERLTTGNVTLSDYNLYNTPNAVWKWGSSYDSFATWQGRGFDAHGKSGNPNLDGNYKLQATSALAIGSGINLNSLCNGQPNPGLGALCFDKAGVARPAAAAWDIGAYQYAAAVGTAPTITTTTLPGGTVGTAYSQTLAATGDTPITWTLSSGTLPTSLSLSSAGVISGTPTTAATSNFSVQATNATGPAINGPKALSIQIVAAAVPVGVLTGSLNFGNQRVNQTSASQTATLQNTGNAPLTFSYSITGDFAIVPGGCTTLGGSLAALASCNFAITFTPRSPGAKSGTLTVADNDAAGSHTTNLSGTGGHHSEIGSGIGTGSTTIGAYTVVTPPSGDFAELPRAYVGVTGQSLSTLGPPGGTYDREEQLGYGTNDHPATCAGLTAAYNDWVADGDEWFRARVLAGSLLQTASACIDLPTKVVAGNSDKRPTKYFVIESSSPATAGQTICSHDFRSDAARNPTCTGDTSHLWTIESTAVSSNPVQLQSVDVNGNGINHIIIRDLEVREQAGLSALDYFLVTVGDSTQTTVASWPHEIGIDRVWAHGDHDDCPGGTCTGSNNVENGFYLESCLDCWVINSQVSRLLWAGHEGHGFSCIECRQVKIVNNWIEGPSIHLFCGGAPVNTQGEQGCTDTEIRKNRLSHPASWLALSAIPPYAGIGDRYHKNCMEFKTASRVLVEDNICEYIDNSGQQSGRLFGFSPRIYNNLDDNYDVTVNNLTIAYNIGRHACNGIQLIGYSGVGGQSGNGNALGATAYTVIQNLIYDVSLLNPGCSMTGTPINGSAVGLLYNEGAFEMNTGLCTATRNSAATQSTITCPGGVSQNQTQVSAGELINVLDCSDTSFNMPTATGNPTGVVPALSPTVRTSLSVTYANPVPGQGNATTTGCTLQRHGHPRGSYIAHNTFIGDSSVAGKTFAIKDDGTARARAFTQDGTYLDNIWTSNLGIKELNGGPAEGTVSEAMQWDVGSTLFKSNLLVGRNASAYTDYNPRGVPANPSTANYFPTYEYCSTTDPTVTSCVGFVGLMNVGAHNFNLADWHGYRLCAASDAACNHKASVFAAGQAKQASDGKDMGVDFNALDVHLGSTRALCPFVQPPLCTSVGSVITGSFPD